MTNFPKERNDRQDELTKAYAEWKRLDMQYMLLYAFEGYGKSYCTHLIHNDRL